MKLENLSENENTHSKPNGNEEHANGITDDDKAIFVSKEAITTKALGKRKDEKTNGFDDGSRLNGLSYKGRK